MTEHPKTQVLGVHPETLPQRFARLWRADGLAAQIRSDWPGRSTGEAAVLFLRIKLLTAAAFVVVLPLLAVAVVGLLAGYQTLPIAMIKVLGAFAVLNGSVTQVCKVWLLFRLGGWSTRGGTIVRRTGQPVQFWGWAVVSTIVAVVWFAAVGFLFWTVVVPR